MQSVDALPPERPPIGQSRERVYHGFVMPRTHSEPHLGKNS